MMAKLAVQRTAAALDVEIKTQLAIAGFEL
jgi:hypothetical protein